MHINNSLASSQALAQVKSPITVDQQQLSARVQVDQDASRENENKASKASRFDVDEQTLAIVAQQSANKPQDQNKTNRSGYDQPSEQNYTAISAYQTVDSLAQREKIQQTFGVDFFA